jgi:hypothetical protein
MKPYEEQLSTFWEGLVQVLAPLNDDDFQITGRAIGFLKNALLQ